MKVWIIYVEHNKAATPEIIGVYASAELAKEARKAEVKERIEGGHSIYPRGEGEPKLGVGFDHIGWGQDVRIEEREVIGCGTHPGGCE